MSLPVLYSFRRCPYAIRARLALRAAGLGPGRDLELREVSLKAKPPELLDASPAGTVPVLQVSAPAPQVLAQSLEIVAWARGLGAGHPATASAVGTASDAPTVSEAPTAVPWSPAERALLQQCDGPFKHHLDRCKYPERYGLTAAERDGHLQACLQILAQWEQALPGPWWHGDRMGPLDWALLPFLRQWAQAHPAALAAAALPRLRDWLQAFLASDDLAAVLDSPWAERRPWRSPRWIYHLALVNDWHQARRQGEYRRSTRGRSLEEVGFVHASELHQVPATYQRFYQDLPAGALVLLTLDPTQLPVRFEADPATGELFPHVNGPLPLAAVLRAEPYGPEVPVR